MKQCFYTILFFSLSCNVIKTSKGLGEVLVRFDDKHIYYQGRVAQKEDVSQLYWPGSSVRVRFFGTSLSADLTDYNGQNYCAIIVDGVYKGKIRVDAARKQYVIAEDLVVGQHEVEIFKTTQINEEYGRGFVNVHGFKINGRILKAVPLSQRKMEFYGNSITCGHAVEDSSGEDSGASLFENNYFSYAAITARNFNAQYSCIAVSGIGLFSGFRKITMPEVFNLRNPLDKTDSWNFSFYQPDVVVINLLQNDEAVVGRPGSDSFRKKFGETPPTAEFIIDQYKTFIKKLRHHYPSAYIICVLGNMSITRQGSAWPSYVTKAVATLNDKKIDHFFFKYKGIPGHPDRTEHQDMANTLTDFINKKVGW